MSRCVEVRLGSALCFLHPSRKPVLAKAKVQNQKCTGTFPSLDRCPPCCHLSGQSKSHGQTQHLGMGKWTLPCSKRSDMARDWDSGRGEELSGWYGAGRVYQHHNKVLVQITLFWSSPSTRGVTSPEGAGDA